MDQGAFNQIAGELAKAGLTPETERIITHLENRRITPEKELQKMEFLFKLFHKPCFPRGELVAFSGKAKSGKTFISSILMTLWKISTGLKEQLLQISVILSTHFLR